MGAIDESCPEEEVARQGKKEQETKHGVTRSRLPYRPRRLDDLLDRAEELIEPEWFIENGLQPGLTGLDNRVPRVVTETGHEDQRQRVEIHHFLKPQHEVVAGDVGHPDISDHGVVTAVADHEHRLRTVRSRLDNAAIPFQQRVGGAADRGVLIDQQQPSALKRRTLLLGRFGVEGLWLSEAEAGAEQARLGGTAQPDAAALLTTSLDDAVHGEEVFAAGAYLHRPSHLGSLATEDALRVLVVVAILGGVVLASLGWLG